MEVKDYCLFLHVHHTVYWYCKLPYQDIGCNNCIWVFGGKLVRKVERVSKEQYLLSGVGIQGKR